MREIKFRMWSKDLNHMYYHEDNKNSPNLWNIINHVDGGKIVNDNRNIVMQYTGLKDKNGKEIYEWDILKFINLKGKADIFVIEWNKKEARYTDYYPKDEVIIIGNIYENPELSQTM